MSRMSILRINQLTKPIIRALFVTRTTSNTRKIKNDSSVDTYRGGDHQLSKDVRPVGEKVKEAAKTTSYLSVILLGIGVTGAMFYTIFSELFSSNSPNSIYSKALDRCINDSRIEDLLGAPIKGFGEETRRGRRGHVSHITYIKNGVKHLKMRFYIKGTMNRATVHLEMAQNSAGSYEYRYLIVELDDFSKRTVVLENNTVQKDSFSTDSSILSY